MVKIQSCADAQDVSTATRSSYPVGRTRMRAACRGWTSNSCWCAGCLV